MKLEKVTKRGRDQPRRWYQDACGAAHGIELIGERWALLVMRELMFGPRRFGELRAGLPGISANVLTQRLEGLAAAGILARRRLPPPAALLVYELTPWGYQSEPIFQALGRWAARSPGHDPSLPLSAVSLMLSLRAMLDRDRLAGLQARVGLRCGDEAFLAVLGPAGLTITREDPAAADAVLSAPPAAIAAVIYGGQPLDTIHCSGDRQVAARFVTLFPLPPKTDARGR